MTYTRNLNPNTCSINRSRKFIYKIALPRGRPRNSCNENREFVLIFRYCCKIPNWYIWCFQYQYWCLLHIDEYYSMVGLGIVRISLRAWRCWQKYRTLRAWHTFLIWQVLDTVPSTEIALSKCKNCRYGLN